MADGEKAKGYEHTFPLVDAWLIYDRNTGVISMTDGYKFEKSDYFPPRTILFEGLELHIQNRPKVVLDAMYKDWKKQIHVYSWCHRLMKPTLKKLKLDIKVNRKEKMIKC